MGNDIQYFRGLVGARLANKDNWIIVIAGSKKFVNFVTDRPMPKFEGALIIRAHPVVAADIAGHPELWVWIGAQPKQTDPVEVKRELDEMAEELRRVGVKGPLDPEQDILVILEPTAPKWAWRLVGNYMEFIRTGEGSMGSVLVTELVNPYCILIPNTPSHFHCVGRDAALAFRDITAELMPRKIGAQFSPTKCLAPARSYTTFTYAPLKEGQ